MKGKITTSSCTEIKAFLQCLEISYEEVKHNVEKKSFSSEQWVEGLQEEMRKLEGLQRLSNLDIIVYGYITATHPIDNSNRQHERKNQKKYLIDIFKDKTAITLKQGSEQEYLFKEYTELLFTYDEVPFQLRKGIFYLLVKRYKELLEKEKLEEWIKKSARNTPDGNKTAFTAPSKENILEKTKYKKNHGEKMLYIASIFDSDNFKRIKKTDKEKIKEILEKDDELSQYLLKKWKINGNKILKYTIPIVVAFLFLILSPLYFIYTKS